MADEGVTLKEYVLDKFKSLELAITLARESMEKRLEGMNEFRETLKDQSINFITRAEHNSEHNKINEDIRVLRESKALLEGKASQSSVNRALIISLAALLIGIISVVIAIYKK